MKCIEAVLLLLGLTVVVLSDKIKIDDCGSKNGKVLEVQLSGCTEAEDYCILKRNSNATIDIKFEANSNAETLSVIVHGIVMDFPTPFPMPNPDACKDSGIECPIESGKTYDFTTTLPILKSYPRISVDIQFQLKSGDEDFVCVLIPAKLH